jgi:hypothetical protein
MHVEHISATAALLPLKDAAGEVCVPLLIREIRAGVSRLWECRDDTDCLYVITRLDRNPDELVICYIQGTGARKFVPWFVERAREYLTPVRLHTTSKTILRLARPYGFRLAEYVARCDHSRTQ